MLALLWLACGRRSTPLSEGGHERARSVSDRASARFDVVPHTGFEPVISALRGRCPGPLDECGAVGREDSTRRPDQASATPVRLEPVVLQERADGVGDLLVALLADDQAVVGVRTERLVLRAQPLRQPLAVGSGNMPVDARRR